MISFPNAKINLGLNIVARRPDGYHDIETVFYPIALHDILEMVPAQGGEPAQLHMSGNAVDCPPEKNLVMKAYRLMQQQTAVPEVDIYLHKHIPDGAGLGGGSADASFMLRMLRDAYAPTLGDGELAAMASKIGADCAFFIYNRPTYATGIGNVFTPLEVDLSGYWLLLVKPPVYVSTAAAYQAVQPRPSQVPIPQLLQQPVSQWRNALRNDFEPSVFAQFPLLAAIKQQLYDCGALYASMSGSGSSMFGIFESDILAEKASHEIAGGVNFVIKLDLPEK